MFRRVLVANRGEIAVRIIRALREMNIASVAGYSKEDATSLHVRLADYRVCIGEGSPRGSYLNAEALITAALNFNCDAVHPGYGFLSENSEFAALCRQNGLIFIGPSPEVISQMGNKTAARAFLAKEGITVVPGTYTPVYTVPEALKEAETIGFPVMIKAAAGGGGKGMRICRESGSFSEAFTLAQQEALNAFADNGMYLEKYIPHARHIEIQIAADDHGRVVSMAERDCSIQRSHQKIIEETPSPAIDNELRNIMSREAEKAASVCGYRGLGTVEFLLDEDKNYYFLEMNTRLQVEHGITEMVCGTDLVKEQIRIACGEPLSFSKSDIIPRGWAMECRVNAEIPEQNFMPSPGTVRHLHLPAGNGVRVDTALYPGCTIPPEYDAMIAKIMVCASDRDSAVRKMRTALDETVITGIDTNLDFLYKLIETEAFRQGRADAGFLNLFINGGKNED